MSLRSQVRARRVLLVEDDPAIRSIISEVCRRGGYDVVEVATGSSALESVRGQEPDLVLLDWVLPDLSGIEVCRELRRRGASCPIVMLTGRTSKVDVVVGLEVGADDYITKPFDARELTARLAANLRRVGRASGGPSLSGLLRLGGVVIDVDGRRVLVGGKEIRLTLTEFNLLRLLATNAGRVLSRDQLLEKVWGYEAEVDHHSVDPHVQRLRRKLTAEGDSGVAVDAVPGLGYRLSVRG
jgi:DNA-binding response OmpR family regulator